MHSKTRIAALIAALLLGGQAGIASMVESGIPGTVLNVETTEPPSVMAVPDYQAATPETSAPAIPAAASAPAATASAPPAQVEERGTIRGWFASMWDRIVSAFRKAPDALRSAQTALLSPTPPSSAFPQGSDSSEDFGLLPVQFAHLERIERERTYVATGNPFPEGSDGEPLHLMPVQVAYFERLEQQRLASLAPQPAPQAAITPSANGDTAQAGSAELTMLNEASVSNVR